MDRWKFWSVFLDHVLFYLDQLFHTETPPLAEQDAAGAQGCGEADKLQAL